MKLVVGLGNPGKSYEKTKHNIGFIILDNLLGNVSWHKDKDAYTYVTDEFGEKVCFVKPLTFMNLSGNAVGRIANFYKIDLNDILIIHDDLDLSIGSYKLKFDSSSGGHNGIKSIIAALGSQKFFRFKIGIGHNRDMDTKDYVLDKLSKNEINDLNKDLYKDIVISFIKDGKDKTMAKYNGKAQ